MSLSNRRDLWNDGNSQHKRPDFSIPSSVEQFGKIVAKVRLAEPNLMQICDARASFGQKSLIQSLRGNDIEVI